MIVDKLENKDRYRSCHPNIAAALDYIAEQARNPELKDGTVTLIPDQVIVHVITKESHKREEARMEIHKEFMDIHCILKGAESCSTSPLPPEDQIEYNPETDNGFWDTPDSFCVKVSEGEFYAVWPMEPHCPLCNASAEAETVRKFICKVRV